MTETIFRIVYCSRATADGPVEPPELARILATSRRNNADVNVTGALLYNRGFFVQLLEGSFDAVQSVFERIQADPRHDAVVVLQAETVESRIFAEWAMAEAQPESPRRTQEILSHALVEGSTAASCLINLLSHVAHHAPA